MHTVALQTVVRTYLSYLLCTEYLVLYVMFFFFLRFCLSNYFFAFKNKNKSSVVRRKDGRTDGRGAVADVVGVVFEACSERSRSTCLEFFPLALSSSWSVDMFIRSAMLCGAMKLMLWWAVALCVFWTCGGSIINLVCMFFFCGAESLCYR